jgi:Na+/H+-translocating membrane pyrophosphatase
MFEPWLIAPIAAVISILVGLYFYRYVDKQDTGTERMKEISGHQRRRKSLSEKKIIQ